MLVAVTGRRGFVGTHVARELDRRGLGVLSLGADGGPPPPLSGERAAPIARPWSARALQDLFEAERPDALIHLAGGPRSLVADLYRDNVVLSETVLEAWTRVRPDAPAVTVGSAAEYGRPGADGRCREVDVAAPVGAYGIAKLAQTRHAELRAQDGRPVVAARLFNPVGPGMGASLAFSSFAHRLARGERQLATGPLDAVRDFFPASEAARILVDLCRLPVPFSGTVNVCSGVGTPVRAGLETLLDRAERVHGVRCVVQEGAAERGGIASVVGATERLRSLGIAPASPRIDEALGELFEWTLNAPTW